MNKIQNKKQFLIFLILISAIVVILNIAFQSFFLRFDLTKNNMYSLSNSSKKIIKKLDDRIIAKVYFSDNLPGQYANSRRYLQDLLEEYQAYSGGNFHFEFINPDDDKDAQQEAMSYRIPPIQLQVIENDKMEVKKVYMGLVLLYDDKNEVMPVIKDATGLEYELTATIKKLASTNMKSVGIYSGKQEIVTDKLKQVLSQTYNIQDIALDTEIPLEINTLMIQGISDTLSIDKLYYLDQFLMRGGNLFVGTSRISAQLQQGIGNEIKTNFYDFLGHYGIKVGRDMLIDKNCGQIQVQQKHGIFSFASAIDYPPFITVNTFNKENLMVKDLEEAQTFFVNEISPFDQSVNFTSLMSTSGKTGVIKNTQMPVQQYGQYTMAEGYNIRPDIRDNAQMTNPMMKNFPEGSKTIAGLVTGNFSSYFLNNEDKNQSENFISENSNTNILVIGDNEFFNDNAAGGIPSNVSFIINGIDYLSGDQELIEIRSRGVTSRPLKELTNGQKSFWKWTNILLPSLLVLLYGFFRMKRNKTKQNILEEIYG